MVRKPRLVDQQTLDLRLALRRRQRTQVNLLELQWPAVVDNRRRLAVDDLECGPQVFTASDDDVQRLLQHLDVQLSPKPHRLGFVVNRLSSNRLLHKPDALLVGAERARERAVAGRDRLIDRRRARLLQQFLLPGNRRIRRRKIVGAQPAPYQRRLFCDSGFLEEIRQRNSNWELLTEQRQALNGKQRVAP